MSEKAVRILDTIDEINANQWNTLVSQADLGTVFHRYEWLKAVETGFESEPRHIVVEKGHNPIAIFPNFYDSLEIPVAKEVVSMAPVRWLNSVNPGYGGPVIGGSEQDCLELMLDALEELEDTRTLYHWIRTNDQGYTRYGRTLMRRGYRPITDNCRFRLNLDLPWEEIWDGMESDYRRRLRQMGDHDVEYRDESIATPSIERFYAEHARNLERTDADPYPFGFYDALGELMPERLKILTVVVDGQEVGQYLYLLDEERSTLHHYLTGIGDGEYYQYNPSQLLHAHAIQWAQEHGYDYYDFGSTRAEYTNGVFRHKEGYGGETVPNIKWERGMSPVGWPAFLTARTLYRKTRG